MDLVCYRRHGHSEADEPYATQPVMYRIIKNKATPRALYAEKLIATGCIGPGTADEKMQAYRQALDAGQHVATNLARKVSEAHPDWIPYQEQACFISIDTGVPPTTPLTLPP